MIINDFGLDSARGSATPSDKEMFKKACEGVEATELEGSEATRFRAAVAKLNYMSSERPDLQYATKQNGQGRWRNRRHMTLANPSDWRAT